ncbi:helix-turn-helix domain-containing protein [uncultured Megasphaera sp.]|mgnify:FL=1|jgi:transcriptional regulator with XRE-family HTH domain|uniref:helix-turn-helix domain-containing protein n=1 Tax=Megasphaera sp. TaxID=2023260 RepID=UPI002670AD73|nr:helix-turn-helix transcriptional regulator [uncultured Megasphaera sp.]
MIALKNLREEKRMTQAELSKDLEISPSAIGMYEQGRRVPDVSTLKKISAYFNVSIDYLLGNSTSKDIHTSNIPPLPSPKDEQDIVHNLEKMIAFLGSSATKITTEDAEDRKLLRASLEIAMKIAKKMAKKKTLKQ